MDAGQPFDTVFTIQQFSEGREFSSPSQSFFTDSLASWVSVFLIASKFSSQGKSLTD